MDMCAHSPMRWVARFCSSGGILGKRPATSIQRSLLRASRPFQSLANGASTWRWAGVSSLHSGPPASALAAAAVGAGPAAPATDAPKPTAATRAAAANDSIRRENRERAKTPPLLAGGLEVLREAGIRVG